MRVDVFHRGKSDKKKKKKKKKEKKIKQFENYFTSDKIVFE
jgi:hypothetical protein